MKENRAETAFLRHNYSSRTRACTSRVNSLNLYLGRQRTVELNQKTGSNAAMQGAVPSLSLSKNPPTSGGAGS